jgi:polyhydroxyalkanoate synthesis repressor PhaR
LATLWYPKTGHLREEPMGEKRIIKRYTNRKLYDKQESRYVTLEEIARLVRRGEDLKVVDNETEEDLTAVTLAQIILEEEKKKTNLLSVPFLRKLIRSGEATVQDLSDRATRGFEALGDLTERAGERVREVMGGSGKALEGGLSFLDDLLEIPQRRLSRLREAARVSLDKLRANPAVRRELERITKSLEALEEAISRLGDEPESSAATGGDDGSDEAGSRAQRRPAHRANDNGTTGESPVSGGADETARKPADPHTERGVIIGRPTDPES